MSIVLFSYSWPSRVALYNFLSDSGFEVTQIYQDEEKLLRFIHENPSVPLIFDGQPHRKLLLLTAIASLSSLRSVYFTSQRMVMSDKVVAELYFGSGSCLTYSEFVGLTIAKLKAILTGKRLSDILLPGVYSPRMINIYSERDVLYKLIQNKIYQEFYIIGASSNEINALRLFISGLSIGEIAAVLGVREKTVYAYRAHLTQRAGYNTSSRELVRTLSISENNQDNEFFKMTYLTRCNNEMMSCEKCGLHGFCFDTPPQRNKESELRLLKHQIKTSIIE